MAGQTRTVGTRTYGGELARPLSRRSARAPLEAATWAGAGRPGSARVRALSSPTSGHPRRGRPPTACPHDGHAEAAGPAGHDRRAGSWSHRSRLLISTAARTLPVARRGRHPVPAGGSPPRVSGAGRGGRRRPVARARRDRRPRVALRRRVRAPSSDAVGRAPRSCRHTRRRFARGAPVEVRDAGRPDAKANARAPESSAEVAGRARARRRGARGRAPRRRRTRRKRRRRRSRRRPDPAAGQTQALRTRPPRSSAQLGRRAGEVRPRRSARTGGARCAAS